MKLYTRSELLKMMDFFPIRYKEFVEFIDALEPIELPTDEEIEIESYNIGSYIDNQLSFSAGAKYVINKIQGGNK